MIGAFIGDIAGSLYEFNNTSSENFDIITDDCFFTDDTVLTFAVAKALLEGKRDETKTKQLMAKYIYKFGHKYPDAGYGGRFIEWLSQKNPGPDHPYNSLGNGSAMRVSPAGWFSHSLSETEKFAEISAAVTHSHPEGLTGAKAVAAAIFLAREGRDKSYIKKYISMKYGYDFSKTYSEYKKDFRFDVTCRGTVPVALEIFFEFDSFEEILRKTIALGGDSDTLAAISCSIAEAMYPVPEEIEKRALSKLDGNFLSILKEWDNDLSIARSPFKRRSLLDYKDYMMSNPVTMRQEIKNPNSAEKFIVPVYDDIMFNFIKDAKDSEFICEDWKNTFEKHGIRQYEDMIIELPDASEKLLKSMLTYILEAERINPGNVAWAAENGIIGDILCDLDYYSKL